MTKRKAGRPSKYKEKYCNMLIEHLAQGLSIVSFAASIDVCEDTIYEWFKVHPNFSEAKRVAMAKYQAKWEEWGINGMLGNVDGFGHTNWIFNMKCRFKWVEKSEVETNTKIEIFIDKEDAAL